VFATTIDFFALLSAALVVGTMFGVWLSFDPTGLNAAAYVVQQQRCIRSLNVIMPVLGGVTVLLTIASAVLSIDDRARFALLVSAAACFVAAGLVTRFANQPINAIVMTWSAEAPAVDWARRRDDWWRWHILRTVFGLGGLCLLIAAALKPASPG
jgi:uncharacterized membrane protein